MVKMFSFISFYKVSLALCLIAAVFAEDKKPAPPTHWNYAEVKQWKEHFTACGGEHQSPINLDLNKATVLDSESFSFFNYDKPYSEMVSNNGHTVMMRVDPSKSADELPYITGGGLTDRYIFAQLHFHWGKDTLRGSEHRIANRQYPAELHLVHYNSKYGNFNNALAYPDGLAVLGVMIELEARDNIAFRHLEHFEEIINPDTGKSSYLPYSIPLSDLIPDSTASFYRYEGSLTTPTCNEDVIWTVFDTPIAISERQLDKFRALRDSEGAVMEDNFRPVQELHDRKIFYRMDDSV